MNTMEMIKATEEHVELIAELFNSYRMFYQQESDLDGAREYISARLKNNESVIFLACNEARTKGYGFTQLYPTFSSVSMKRVWVLNDLYVSEEARRKGIANQLMDAAKELAVSTGAKGLALETAEDNAPAQALYESLGYEKESGFYHYFLTV